MSPGVAAHGVYFGRECGRLDDRRSPSAYGWAGRPGGPKRLVQAGKMAHTTALRQNTPRLRAEFKQGIEKSN